MHDQGYQKTEFCWLPQAVVGGMPLPLPFALTGDLVLQYTRSSSSRPADVSPS